jgi:CRISPR-associated endonuclease/helicase Cas3
MRGDEEAAYFSYWGKARPDAEAAPFHLLPFHSLDVAAVGRCYLERNGALTAFFARRLGVSRAVVTEWLVYWLALHDLGKFASAFQGQCLEAVGALRGGEAQRPYTVLHDTLGFYIWLELVARRPEALGLGRGARRFRDRLSPWAAAVTGHHGQPPSEMAGSLFAHCEAEDLATAGTFAEAVRPLLLSAASLEIMLSLDAARHKRAAQELSWWLAGVSVLADWLGSNTQYFPYRAEPLSLAEYWERHAQPAAERALDESGVAPQRSAPARGLRALFADRAIAELTPLQTWAEAVDVPDGPQLYFLEDVTGAGKTEAALTLAHRLMAAAGAAGSAGLFVALPTMATANAMFSRVEEVAGRMFVAEAAPSIVLAYSQRHLSERFRQLVIRTQDAESDPRQRDETASARCTAWLADHNKRALLANVGVGTIDQVLLAVLHAKHQSLRLLGLFGKVLVVDEVHACDAYMLKLLRTVLRFHAMAGGHAILLSATLTREMKQRLADAFAEGAGWTLPALTSTDYPLATKVHAGFEAGRDECPVATRPSVRRHVRVDYTSDLESMVASIRQATAEGKCVCWVRNTVADAVAAWERMAQQHPEIACTLFHARFAMGDRIDIENDVLTRFGRESDANTRRGRLVIATQVIEQSLDVDFDWLVSDLAPIDRLVQRAGRMQRHARDANGNPVASVDERGDAAMLVYGPEWSDDPSPNWLKAVLPGTGAVYPHHGQLWLTAARLRRGGFDMPDDARALIEGVFGDEADIPEGLQRNADEVEGQDWARTNMAAAAALALEGGYRRDATVDWATDDETPAVGVEDEWQLPAATRDAEPATTVRLATVRDGRLVPWRNEGDYPWDLSSLRVAKRLIAETHSPSPGTEMDAALAQLPDKGKWSVLLVLCRTDDDAWHGQAYDRKGDLREWRYSRERGLHGGEAV